MWLEQSEQVAGDGVGELSRDQTEQVLVSDEGGPSEVEGAMVRNGQIWSPFCLQDFQSNHPPTHLFILYSLNPWPV